MLNLIIAVCAGNPNSILGAQSCPQTRQQNLLSNVQRLGHTALCLTVMQGQLI